MYAIINWPIVRFKIIRNFLEENLLYFFLDLIPWWIKPNFFSYARIFLAIPINYFIYFNQKIDWATNLFVIAWITDYLDGALARRRREETAFGAALDPFADKILIGSILIFGLYFILAKYSQLKSMLIANILIDILIFFAAAWARVRRKDVKIQSNIFGKLKFGFQSYGVLLIINGSPNNTAKVLEISFWFGVVSLAIYTMIAIYDSKN